MTSYIIAIILVFTYLSVKNTIWTDFVMIFILQ